MECDAISEAQTAWQRQTHSRPKPAGRTRQLTIGAAVLLYYCNDEQNHCVIDLSTQIVPVRHDDETGRGSWPYVCTDVIMTDNTSDLGNVNVDIPWYSRFLVIGQLDVGRGGVHVHYNTSG